MLRRVCSLPSATLIKKQSQTTTVVAATAALREFRRMCSGTTATPPAAHQQPEAQQGTHQPKTLDDLENVSDHDRELLKKAFHAPESLPKYDKAPMGSGGGAGLAHGDMAAVFTCNVCKHRSVKRFTKHAYTQGIVIVQCGGCGSKHLLADHLGWFEDEHKTIEEVLRARGESVQRLSAAVHIDKLQKNAPESPTKLTEEEAEAEAAVAAGVATASDAEPQPPHQQ